MIMRLIEDLGVDVERLVSNAVPGTGVVATRTCDVFHVALDIRSSLSGIDESDTWEA